MPNWKKVIVSGSNASLNSLNVVNGVTGSLFGTASYANFALTSSNSQNAQDILIYVKNVTGAQINKGKVVRISGATGDNALISTASYESDPVSANTLGITNQDIPNDSFGYVITEGTLIGINTDTFSAGQLLYLGATGSIIGTAPVAPLHAVRLGQVLRVQTNNGSMYVRIDNGYELGELHDVVDTTTTSSYGDLLIKSGSVWINSKQLTGSYGLTGSLNISGSLAVGTTGSGIFGRIDASNDVVAFSTSDIRFKENIYPINNALNKIDEIGGYTFDWKTNEELVSLHGHSGHDVGVIAHEIESILPEVVTTRDNGYKAVKYEKLVPLLIQAIKELKAEVDSLKTGNYNKLN
jgi:hypothetical protein